VIPFVLPWTIVPDEQENTMCKTIGIRQTTANGVFLVIMLLLWRPDIAMAQARSEIPIREVVLSDGERRHSVPIQVGGTMIEAGLDTGSTGLRILPGVLASSDAKGNNKSETYTYGSGTRFGGEVGTGTLAMGQFSAPITMELIGSVRCAPGAPRCPASRVTASEFGIMGSGHRGEGFRAILGVSMAEAAIQSPLPGIGAARWIVELPRPDSEMPGKLILNPEDSELGGFVMLPVLSKFSDQEGGYHDAVLGCIVSDARADRVCGALLMDTGSPGISVRGAGKHNWAAGSAATLAFYDKEKLLAGEKITLDSRSHASHLSFAEAGRQQTMITIAAGLTPYFAFDVLYDPGKSMVGLKPRPAAPDAPIGAVASPAN
jgi:hypothetical protein